MKRLLKCLVVLSFLLLNSSSANSQHRYKKKARMFLNSIRDSVLANSRLGKFTINDTLIVRNYLSNKGVLSMVLSDVYLGRGLLREQEKSRLIHLATKDTSSFFIDDDFIERSRTVDDNNNLGIFFQKVSKPIFLRRNKLCVICIGTPEAHETLLFERISRKKWVFVKLLGFRSVY